MPRSADSGQLDLSDVFLKVQQELLAQMAVGGLFEHASAAGTATERQERTERSFRCARSTFDRSFQPLSSLFTVVRIPKLFRLSPIST
jgi:hypothetical protein